MSNKRLYRVVADKLLQLMDGGDIPVGGKLPPERELALRFGVSRPMVREAIIALEVVGRVEVKNGSGVVVLPPPRHDGAAVRPFGPFELTQARAVIESEAAAIAAATISAEQFAQLQSAYDRMVAADGRDEAAATEADHEFHLVIARATGNAVMLAMIEQLWEIRANSPECRRVYGLTCRVAGSREAEHRDILAAMRARDAEAARLSMRRHFARLLDNLLSAAETDAIREVKQRALESRARYLLGADPDLAPVHG